MPRLPPDPYKVLGVRRGAKVAELRAVRRRLLLQLNPDAFDNPTDKARAQSEFQRVVEAYHLLTDPQRLSEYQSRVRLEELRAERIRDAQSYREDQHVGEQSDMREVESESSKDGIRTTTGDVPEEEPEEPPPPYSSRPPSFEESTRPDSDWNGKFPDQKAHVEEKAAAPELQGEDLDEKPAICAHGDQKTRDSEHSFWDGDGGPATGVASGQVEGSPHRHKHQFFKELKHFPFRSKSPS